MQYIYIEMWVDASPCLQILVVQSGRITMSTTQYACESDHLMYQLGRASPLVRLTGPQSELRNRLVSSRRRLGRLHRRSRRQYLHIWRICRPRMSLSNLCLVRPRPFDVMPTRQMGIGLPTLQLQGPYHLPAEAHQPYATLSRLMAHDYTGFNCFHL